MQDNNMQDNNLMLKPNAIAVGREVLAALREDLAENNCDSLDFGRDLSAQLLGDTRDEMITAVLKTRDNGVLCGTAWFDESIHLCSRIKRLDWHYQDGDRIEAGAELCTLVGTRGGLLTAERTAINFIQMLSGVATRSRSIADQVEVYYANSSNATITKILDTRKSIPNLRHAQKYAVRIGGCHNHRFSLNDAVMIKENHIIAAGGIAELVNKATAMKSTSYTKDDHLPIILEVENLEQLQNFFTSLLAFIGEADNKERNKFIDIVMLDNFSVAMIKEAVTMRDALIKDNKEVVPEYEVSGNVTPTNLKDYLGLGVERISMGYLMKDYESLDFSLRFINN